MSRPKTAAVSNRGASETTDANNERERPDSARPTTSIGMYETGADEAVQEPHRPVVTVQAP